MIAYRSAESVISTSKESEKYKEYAIKLNNAYIPAYFNFRYSPFPSPYPGYPVDYADVYVGKYVNACDNILKGLSYFNNNVYIGENVISSNFALENCYNFASHIFFKGTSSRTITANNLLRNAGYNSSSGIYLNKYIHCHKNLAPAIYSANVWGDVSWTQLSDNNGWYNSTYNIYLYNNYSGE